MRILWNNNHAEIGPFKLNVYRSRSFEDKGLDLWIWMASTPGYTNWGGHDLVSEEVAKASAEAWVADQLVKFMVDLGINPDIAFDDTVKCEPCYGTGRWGSNGAEGHEPCKSTGRIPAPVIRCIYGCVDGVVNHAGWKTDTKGYRTGAIELFQAPCPRHGKPVAT